jgi:hypothetical protein
MPPQRAAFATTADPIASHSETHLPPLPARWSPGTGEIKIIKTSNEAATPPQPSVATVPRFKTSQKIVQVDALTGEALSAENASP